MSHFEVWLIEYGASALFVMLALGIIGLPVPDETLIITAGVLVAKGKLLLIPTLIAIYGGAMIGITLSYLLGYFGGYFLINRYGSYIGLSSTRITKAMEWYKQYGKWLLFFGYFIIGMRHFTGLISGMMKLDYKQFALFAYSGLVLWVSALFLFGYSFGHSWRGKFSLISSIAIILAILSLCTIYLYYFYKQKKLH